jgi:polyisoprenyl-phosphate glycosyltransferase
MTDGTIILIPVYNDWASLQILSEKLKTLLHDEPVSLLVVNDGSTETPQPLQSALPLKVLHLSRNIGHQKAIAIALSYIAANLACERVLIMDADGEDRPEDAVALLQASAANPGRIIFAQRTQRTEGLLYRLCYKLYKLSFAIFTGRTIAYGNFSLIPVAMLKKIVHYSEIWNHIPGGILRSKLPHSAIPTAKGNRFAGKSKMNFNSLLLHGLGAIAVFVDVIATRLLVVSVGMILVSLLAIAAIFAIKTFTSLAIPGWASSVMSAMFIILLQSFLLSLFTIFLYLSSQSQRKFIPAQHYTDYVDRIETVSE